MEPSQKHSRDISPWEAMGLVWDILITVIVLTLLFAFGGIYLDRIANTKFLFTVLGFIGLIFVGKSIMMKKAKKITDRMNGNEQTNQKT